MSIIITSTLIKVLQYFIYVFFFFRINALEEQIESQKLTTGKQVEEESFKYKLALVGFLVIW